MAEGAAGTYFGGFDDRAVAEACAAYLTERMGVTLTAHFYPGGRGEWGIRYAGLDIDAQGRERNLGDVIVEAVRAFRAGVGFSPRSGAGSEEEL